MPHGCQRGRFRPGLAGLVLAAATAAGCGRLPLQPFGAPPFGPPVRAAESAAVSADADAALEPADAPEAASDDRPADPGPAPPPAPATPEVAPEVPKVDPAALPAELISPPDTSHAPLDPAVRRAGAEVEAPAAGAPAPSPEATRSRGPDTLPELPGGSAEPVPAPPLSSDAEISKPETPKPTPRDESAALAVKDVSAPVTAPAPAQAEVPAKSPTEEWREGIERLRALARDRADDPGGAWKVRALILDALARTGDGEGDSAHWWGAVLPALGVSDEPGSIGEGRDVEAIREAIRALEDRVPLEIAELRLCRKVEGFGNYEPIDAERLKPGQAVILYCELSGLRSEEQGDAFRSRVASRYEIVPTGGGSAVEARSLGVDEDVCRRRRRDNYSASQIRIPEGIVPGPYELRLTQEDAVAGRSTTASLPFTVLPPPTPPPGASPQPVR